MQPSQFMQFAIDAAARVRGTTSPNPNVGAVLVRDGRVISVGATSPPPGPHAEANALASVDAAGTDMYVTLEPCYPFLGKRTPPCSDAIVKAGVRRVFVALEDPDPRVAGQGIAFLRSAGVEVSVGDGRAAAIAGLRHYLKHRTTGLPYVIAKFAASLDGKTATSTGDSKWITGERARDYGHQQRAAVDAIMVGSGTVLADDPSLTARPNGELATHQPVRIILDARGRVAPSARVFAQPGTTLVATSSDAPVAWKQSIAATGAQLIECEPADVGINLDQLMPVLARRSILSIWAEGGSVLLGSLLEHDYVDEVWAFLAPLIIGGDGQPAIGGHGAKKVAEALRLRDPVVESLGDDILVRGYTGRWSP